MLGYSQNTFSQKTQVASESEVEAIEKLFHFVCFINDLAIHHLQ